MPEPVTIAAVAIGGLSWLCHSALGAAAIGGAIGNPADRLIAATFRSVNNRIAGLRGLPENHDVARAVRIAQIQALERVIREYRDAGRPEWSTEPHTRPEIFFRRSLDFCTETIGRCLPNAQIILNLEVTRPLMQTIDGILSEPEGCRPAAIRAIQIARLAEDAVLDELRETLRGVVLPEGFEAHFRNGNAGRRRFLDQFGGFITDQIKQDLKFRAILTTGQLSQIEGLAFDTATIITQVAAKLESIGETVQKGFGDLSTQITDLAATFARTNEAVVQSRPWHSRAISLGIRNGLIFKVHGDVLISEAFIRNVVAQSNDDQILARLMATQPSLILPTIVIHAIGSIKRATEDKKWDIKDLTMINNELSNHLADHLLEIAKNIGLMVIDDGWYRIDLDVIGSFIELLVWRWPSRRISSNEINSMVYLAWKNIVQTTIQYKPNITTMEYANILSLLMYYYVYDNGLIRSASQKLRAARRGQSHQLVARGKNRVQRAAMGREPPH